MFAKSRLALLVGWVTGSVAFPLLAQDAQKRTPLWSRRRCNLLPPSLKRRI